MTLKDNYTNEKRRYNRVAEQLAAAQGFILKYDRVEAKDPKGEFKHCDLMDKFVERAFLHFIKDRDTQKNILIAASVLCLAEIGEDDGEH